MKKDKRPIDDKIQEALDMQNSSFEADPMTPHKELEWYKALYQKLEEPPQFDLGQDFAGSVMKAAYKRKRIQRIRWKVMLYTGISFLYVAVCVIIAISMNPEVVWKTVVALKQNVTVVLFGIILFTIIQLLDKTFVKNKLPGMRT